MMKTAPSAVLQNLEKTMAMKSGDWLEDEILREAKPVILDLRSKEIWEKSHIPGSKQILIQALPDMAAELIPASDSTVICVCNGSIQSAMAVFYLRTEGYMHSYNLSGGFSSWEKNSRPVEPVD